jgi:hypothetical protein
MFWKSSASSRAFSFYGGRAEANEDIVGKSPAGVTVAPAL